MKKEILLSMALIGLTTGAQAMHHDSKGKVKCYGVAKKGQNSCGTSTGPHLHGCAGQAKTDNSIHEWKYEKKEDCMKMGGNLKPGVEKKKEKKS